MRITVNSTPNCYQCRATERALTERGLPFEKFDLTTDEVKLSRFKALGFGSAPVVEIDGVPEWAGFRPDLIAKLEVANV